MEVAEVVVPIGAGAVVLLPEKRVKVVTNNKTYEEIFNHQFKNNSYRFNRWISRNSAGVERNSANRSFYFSRGNSYRTYSILQDKSS
jgi:hypothetical protein